MKLKRSGAAVSLLAAGALLVSACGSDNNTNSAGGASTVDAKICAGKQKLAASGSSAQKNAMERFIANYEASCSGYTLDYNPTGSGQGVSDFLAGLTDFAGSDSPLNADKGEIEKAKARCGSDAWNLPTVFGPIAVAYNLPGVEGVAFDGPTLAKIFKGEITKWNDPAIAALNSGKNLPDKPIVVVFRSDESGTTDNFQKYLAAASDGAYTGKGKAFGGGVGEGADKSDGVKSAVSSTEGAISYMEWSFAKDLNVAKIVTSAGPDAVELSKESAAKAVDSVKIKGEGNDLVLDTSSFYKPTTAGAYPIMLATYEIVCSKYADANVAKAVKAFLTAAAAGDPGDGYVALPEAFKAKLEAAIAAIS
ncbi:phosphate ABC transporter substrate-binding protein PstS [Smaragdicoccus niigatensis]|uniref:phosphate ABC transporter substrate-binding protein PstS n=1 Tax=Smaragdicoccus niigatensis TaxID=359359 RepID=UPI0003763CD4|nr:phosphate ABC transporter substrate-binding protein PstS [Smaragdicoccus niigatensis]